DGILIPAGTQELRWTYIKNGAEEEGVEGAFFLDRVIAFNDPESPQRPDLLIKSLTTTPGTYVLNNLQDPDLDRIPVSAVGENQGYDLPANQDLPTDISIRLSTDRVYGNADDILLGEVARSGSLGSANQVAFGGNLAIPLDTPAGAYYLMAFIDFAGEIVEFNEENNLFITELPDIVVERRADLIVENIEYDTDLIYIPEDIVRLQFDVRNRGLAAVPGNVVFDVQIDLLVSGLPLFDGATSGETINDPSGGFDFGFGANTIPLATLPLSRFISGSNEFNPNGQSISFDLEVSLPTLATLADIDISTIPTDSYALLITVDPQAGDGSGAVLESQEDNRAVKLDSFAMDLPPAASGETFAEWGAAYGINDINGDPDGDGVINLLEYAFNLNPTVPDAPENQGVSGNTGSTSFGIIEFEGDEFLRLTFDINQYAADLDYTVEVSNDNMFFAQFVVLEPPYVDDSGSNSLSGIGGLLDSNPQVISASPRGRTARVTVRDVETAGESPMRFLRLRVTQAP
ncbi:MAG: hypothetical protein AAGA95_17450, partial [Pseudomonadota bacterium]